MRCLRLVPGVLLAGLVSACAAPGASGEAPPMAFHDTRLQAALLADDRETLRRDFAMAAPPGLAERSVAAFVLPFTAATEVAFYPLWTSMQASTELGAPVPGKPLD